MPTRLFAALLIATLFSAQLPAQQSTTPAAPTPAAPAASSTIVIPAGTIIPLTLVTPIPGRTKSAGMAIRAQVAFPVIVGDQVAIPANTFVDGTLDYVTAPTRKNKHPNTFLNFTTLTFPNGYKVTLPATNISQLLLPALPTANPSPQYIQLATTQDMPRAHGPSPSAEFTPDPALAPEPDPTPQALPPLQLPAQPNHDHVGIVIGAVGLFVALTVGLIFLAHHSNSSSSINPSHAAGWQFQLTLQAPLTLDTASINAPIKAN